MLTVGTVFILLSLVCVLAFVMYAYYFDCDPLQAGLIKKADQVRLLFPSCLYEQIDIDDNYLCMFKIYTRCVF